jgi:TrmH family RNA methyltransferase
MELSRVEVVLVRPARAGNVAAACRALKNMGLRSLWLVDPPAGLDTHEARSLAYGAWDVLDAARRARSLPEAVSGSTFVAATTGRDELLAWSPRRLAREVAARAAGGVASLVFGPEASGLTTAELQLCHVCVHVPTDPGHPSLNLAQAVLLVAYEMRLAALDAAPEAVGHAERPAAAGQLEAAIGDLREALLAVGYLDAANPERVLCELRRLGARAAPSERETALLRGLARQVRWAGRVAKASRGNG